MCLSFRRVWLVPKISGLVIYSQGKYNFGNTSLSDENDFSTKYILRYVLGFLLNQQILKILCQATACRFYLSVLYEDISLSSWNIK